MRKIQSDMKEIEIKNTWTPTEFFTNSELAEIYYSVPDYYDIVFGEDLLHNGEKCVYVIPKGSAELTWCLISNPQQEYFAMNLSPNELFDPKDEGIIYIQPDTHEELRASILRIQEIIYEKYSKESV